MPTDVKEHIRAIFLHHIEPVTIEVAAGLLGWDLDTMDAAIKWRAVKLDENSLDAPRIDRAELLNLATDQWQVSEIEEALGRDAKRAFGKKRGRRTAGGMVRSALENIPPAPVAEAVLRRVAAKRRRNPLPAPLPHARRNRQDGIREATLTAFSVEYQKHVPYLRLRGRWLAKLGLRPGMRLYIEARHGRLVITAADPAAASQPSATEHANVVAMTGPRAGGGRQIAVAAAAR